MESCMALHQVRSPSEEAEETFATALEEAEEAQRRVEDAIQVLGQEPDPGGPREMALLEAMNDRKKAATKVGLALLSWRLLGGTISLNAEVPVPGETVDLLDGLGDLLRDIPSDEPAAEPEPLEPEPLVEVKPPRPPAPPPDLSGLVAKFTGKGPPVRSWEDDLMAVMNDLGQPQDIRDIHDLHAEVSRLERASVEATHRWAMLPTDARHALMGVCVTRARYLQDTVMPRLKHPFVGTQIDRMFSQFTAYSADTRPGYVYGLSRTHSPEGKTWLADALTWWTTLEGLLPQDEPDNIPNEKEPLNPEKALGRLDGLAGEDDTTNAELVAAVLVALTAGVSTNDIRLVKILLPHLDKLTREPKLKAVRKAIRSYKNELNAEGTESEADTTVLPADWPFWDYTRDKHALLVGGDKRERTVERFQEVFGFATLEWDSGWQPRRIEALARRIEQGSVDIVILLARFLSHKAWDSLVPVCKEAGVPFILVERGYGVSQVQATMEMVLGRLQGDEE